MRRLVHLSDLHFGRVDPRVCAAVAARVRALAPDVVVVTGDLTQRARRVEFEEARAFLDTLPSPQIVVPGNHDVPLWNVLRRMLTPLARYRRHVTADLAPFHGDAEVAVAGLNTAHAWTLKDGAIAPADLATVCSRLQPLAPGVIKVVASHHPLPSTRVHRDAGGVRRLPVETLVACGVDIFLTGHLHLSYAGHTAGRYRSGGRSAIVVEAGTATSTRLRGETNGFNAVEISGTEVRVERLEWHPAEGEFRVTQTDRFRKTADGWAPVVG